jgi:hypothetical protein
MIRLCGSIIIKIYLKLVAPLAQSQSYVSLQLDVVLVMMMMGCPYNPASSETLGAVVNRKKSL